MDRRKSIKALIVGSVATGVIVEACNNEEKKAPEKTAGEGKEDQAGGINRMKEEQEHEKEVTAKTYFTADELATITLLGDIIIPKDEVSGSASDAGVPAFIEYIVKEKPELQVPMRGGLRWLDLQCLNRYGKGFKDATQPQQTEMVDAIAYPKKAKPDMKQGVTFFNLMRNLTASGFYTSQIGVKDIGYMGNTVNQWNGVPEDVLKAHGLAYTEKELKECYDPTKA
jgi:gluconate 2-dehydrogenase gamma chain